MHNILLDGIEYFFDEVTDWSNTVRERLLLNCSNPIIDFDQNLVGESGEFTLWNTVMGLWYIFDPQREAMGKRCEVEYH